MALPLLLPVQSRSGCPRAESATESGEDWSRMTAVNEATRPGPRKVELSSTWVLFALLSVLAVYLCWRILQPLANVLLWAVVLALMFAPLQRKLLARTRRPNLSAAVTLAVAVFSVLLPVAGISVAVGGEIGVLLEEAPEKWNRWTSEPALRATAARWRDEMGARFPFVKQIDNERIKESLAALGEKMVKRSVSLVGSLLRLLVEFILIVFSLFFLLRDAEGFERALRRLLPLSTRQSDLLIARTVEVVQASALGVIAIAFLQGALGGVLFAILGLPSPILWGVAMAFFAMIPMVGAAAIWLPAVIVLLVTGHSGKAIVLLLFGALVISTIDNFLRPYLVGGRTGMHELVVFFAVLGGLEVFGVVGLLVGPAVFAVAWSMLDLFRESAQRSAEDSDRGPEAVAGAPAPAP